MAAASLPDRLSRTHCNNHTDDENDDNNDNDDDDDNDNDDVDGDDIIIKVLSVFLEEGVSGILTEYSHYTQ